MIFGYCEFLLLLSVILDRYVDITEWTLIEEIGDTMKILNNLFLPSNLEYAG